MSHMWKMEHWNFNVLNQILAIGDRLYEKSVLKLGDKSLGSLSLTQVYPTFFVGRFMVTFQVVDPKQPVEIEAIAEQDQLGTLSSAITKLLQDHKFGVVKMDQKHLAIWKNENAYFLFDPVEHQKDGEPWNGYLGTGFAICVRFPKVRTMADYIIRDNMKKTTLKLKMWPLDLVRFQMMALRAPETLDQIKKQNEDEKKTDEYFKAFQTKGESSSTSR